MKKLLVAGVLVVSVSLGAWLTFQLAEREYTISLQKHGELERARGQHAIALAFGSFLTITTTGAACLLTVVLLYGRSDS